MKLHLHCVKLHCVCSYFYFCGLMWGMESWRVHFNPMLWKQLVLHFNFLMWSSIYEHVNNAYSVFGNLHHPVMMSNSLITSRNYNESKMWLSLCRGIAEPSKLKTSSSCFSTRSLIISVWATHFCADWFMNLSIWCIFTKRLLLKDGAVKN